MNQITWLPGYCGCLEARHDFIACPNCRSGAYQACNSSPLTRPEACCCGQNTAKGFQCGCPTGFTAPLEGCQKQCMNSDVVTRCNLAGTCLDGDSYSNERGKGVPFTRCECIPGHFGWDCQLTCQPPCVKGHGECVWRDGTANPVCLCRPGQIGQDCSIDLATPCLTAGQQVCANRGTCQI